MTNVSKSGLGSTLKELYTGGDQPQQLSRAVKIKKSIVSRFVSFHAFAAINVVGVVFIVVVLVVARDGYL